MKKLTKEQERAVVNMVLHETSFVSGYHKFEKKRHKMQLAVLGLDNEWVYVCISPKIKIKYLNDPHNREYTIYMKNHTEGMPFCEHDMLELYWETGGGGLDTGTGHHYLMCIKCGFHPTMEQRFKTSVKGIENPILRAFLNFLWKILLRRRQYES